MADERELAEQFISFIVGRVLEKRRAELAIIQRDVTKLETVKPPFPRISYDDAVAMLQRLSGRAHEVCSSVFICELAAARSVNFSELSHVYFRRLSRAKIDNYFKRVNPLDKAGAYAAQGFGADIIEKIDGSYTNVIGLPMERIVPALAEFGIEPKAE